MKNQKNSKPKTPYVPTIYRIDERTAEWKRRSDESLKKIMAKYCK